MQQLVKIVITGGPCAGKSTAMSWIQNHFSEKGWTVLFVPETATEFISGGVAPWTCRTNADYQVIQMTLQREKTLGDSRFDLYLEQEGRKAYIEVKGVTLEEEGICRFPDAPTERGIKHLKGLEEAAAAGHTAAVLFVIQMKDVVRFEPHEERHKAFADALRHAAANGVLVLACDCRVTADSMNLKDPVPVIL